VTQYNFNELLTKKTILGYNIPSLEQRTLPVSDGAL